MSHEFRTPLTLMLGPTEDALASPARTLTGDALETLYRNELRLLKLVNALLDFSRIEAGRMQASYEPTDLGQLTADLASTFRSAVERAGLQYVVTCAPLHDTVSVDRRMWEQIVLNLLSNALKFTFDGRIEVSLHDVDDHVVLKVSDTGIGIAAADQPRLFERFLRIEGARSRTHEGSGIGLALVRDLVRLHDGAIDVQSTLGVGTTFTVTLPRHSDRVPTGSGRPLGTVSDAGRRSNVFVEEALRWLPGPDAASDSSPGTTDTVTFAEGLTVAPGRVLVADDNADMRDYLKRLLSAHWPVEAVADGDAALAAIRQRPPDLVLSDVMMPGLDGFELLRALRADEPTSGIPVVLLSARAGEEAHVEGLQSGADDYLIKPFSARELIARINAQMTLMRNRRERAELLAREQDARREAELQKQHLFSLFMQAPMPIAVLRGREHLVELLNKSAEAFWGRPADAMINRPVFEALPDLDWQPFKSLLDGVYDSGVAHVGREAPVEFDRRADGTRETRYLNFVYTPLRNIRDQVEGVLVVAFDVTEEVLAREQMRNLRESAESANRAKDEFLAMLGHELRNPLAPIQTALHLMRLRGDATTERERTVIERQVTYLTRLVDDLLDVSRIARGKMDLQRTRVEMAEAVAKAIETASPLFEQRRQVLDVHVPRSGLAVHGDPIRLAQIVSNLLTNAAKYTETGGRVSIRAENAGADIVLRVRDTGIGISAEMLPRVFDLFVQERQALDRSVGGLGLGLTIVRSLVRLHGGTVSVSSEGPGRGSEFAVRLPAAAVVQPDTAPAIASDHVAEISTAGTKGLRVLVVDDNEDAADMLREALLVKAHDVRVVQDGPTALQVCEEFRPDVALLDIGLPVMDGYELANRLRDLPGLTGMRLVAVTGYGQETDHQRSRAAGFDRHLVKPIDLDALERLLRDFGDESTPS